MADLLQSLELPAEEGSSLSFTEVRQDADRVGDADLELSERPVDATEARRARRSVAFALYRRAVEIRDGQIELRPYLDPAVRSEELEPRIAAAPGGARARGLLRRSPRTRSTLHSSKSSTGR
ncbi:DUF6545 domain-containing protein [Streptomyces viridosporus]|uniref:DUF6545 domain-containing protein n=1 Tax=Streptomyces viridosporus TaxID=67581 RepID=UPI0020FFF8D7|nr:DUF6545 domain-containing protein [Streptomyces viridosporus]